MIGIFLQASLTLYLLGVKKELSGVNSATLHGVKRTFVDDDMERKAIVVEKYIVERNCFPEIFVIFAVSITKCIFVLGGEAL